MKIYFDKSINRLVCLDKKSTHELWDDRWSKINIKDTVLNKNSSPNNLLVYRHLKKYLKSGSKILEGGCGLGDVVYLLEKNRYDSYGIDYAKETVNSVNKYFPTMKVTHGNVECTNYENNFFDGYVSLGVIEHFYDGFDKVINEARRILKDDAILLITIPSLSVLRRLKIRFNRYPEFNRENVNNFYQYIYDENFVISEIEKKGFKLLEHKKTSGLNGLKKDIWIPEIIVNILDKFFNSVCEKIFSPVSGHGTIFIFQKNTIKL
jgi:ubiquinone/menaquinone biosynthesis C-methylase UbiE